MEKPVQRLKTRVADPSFLPHNIHEILDTLALAARNTHEHLQWIKVQHKDSIRLLSVNEIYYFKAADKYTVVRTRDKEFLIKKTIKELAAELSPDQFSQIPQPNHINISTKNTENTS